MVARLQKLFMETWEGQKGTALAPRNYFPTLTPHGKEVVRAIGSAPDEPFSQIYVTLISALNSADTEILLTNAYFVPDPQLMEALTSAAARGVDVKLIVPSATDSWLVFHAGRSHYEPLLAGGVKIYERREALLHAKTARDRRRLGDRRLDQPRLAQLPTQPGVDRRRTRAEFGAKMRAAFERDLARLEPDHARGVAAAAPLGVRGPRRWLRVVCWEYWL